MFYIRCCIFQDICTSKNFYFFLNRTIAPLIFEIHLNRRNTRRRFVCPDTEAAVALSYRDNSENAVQCFTHTVDVYSSLILCSRTFKGSLKGTAKEPLRVPN